MRIMTDTLLFLLQLGLCVCFKMLDKDSAAHTTCQGLSQTCWTIYNEAFISTVSIITMIVWFEPVCKKSNLVSV